MAYLDKKLSLVDFFILINYSALGFIQKKIPLLLIIKRRILEITDIFAYIEKKAKYKKSFCLLFLISIILQIQELSFEVEADLLKTFYCFYTYYLNGWSQ